VRSAEEKISLRWARVLRAEERVSLRQDWQHQISLGQEWRQEMIFTAQALV